MTLQVLLGTGLGIGLWAIAVWMFPPRETLAEGLRRLRATPPAPGAASDAAVEAGGWASSLGRPFAGPLAALGLPGIRIEKDLSLLGRSASVHLAEKAALAIAGLLAPALFAALLAIADVPLGFEFPVLAGLVLATVAFVVPDLAVRAEAAQRRTSFRHALSAYLDLVWITLAGGAGVDNALHDSAAVGRGWAFEEIRRALDAARMTRSTPWLALRGLGERLGVPELTELAASVNLAGTEGARVRASLTAKAGALRTRQLTDAEAAAQSATERMALPVTLLFLGFLVFITYPTVLKVLTVI